MSLVLRDVRLKLRDLSLNLNLRLAKKVTALFGPSGSGKTTVLELVAGLRRPAEGAIELDGVDLADVSAGIFVRPASVPSDMSPRILHSFRISTVRQNILYGFSERESPNAKISSEKLCRLLDIERLLDRRPGFLSGGEKQRVAIARALLDVSKAASL